MAKESLPRRRQGPAIEVTSPIATAADAECILQVELDGPIMRAACPLAASHADFRHQAFRLDRTVKLDKRLVAAHTLAAAIGSGGDGITLARRAGQPVRLARLDRGGA